MREVDLSTQYAVPRKRMRAIRKERMEQGVHWDMVDGQVDYTAAGVALLDGALREGEEKAPEKPPPANGTDVLRFETLRVLGPFGINPKLLRAEGPPEVGEVRLRVARRENFVPGMECLAYEEQDGLWVLAQRLPRYKGRW